MTPVSRAGAPAVGVTLPGRRRGVGHRWGDA
ncbi:hypothetical protein STRAU_3703 [Streptomyces aurantiacus JA 4570]|uniref:Uncharacterized protein n=1 Tax=Streptomyces aurantiacus JA 4570 TaxID=1286094 RepID=S3ZKE6_9ACTN|nr:hypothetical protein STRAU_3703 [Streptomyces aurantiacus JA 4570]